MTKLHFWPALALGLFVSAVPVKFLLRGYDYIAYSMVLLAAVIAAFCFLPDKWIRALLVIFGILAIYFCIVELFILSAAKTDESKETDYLIVLGAGVEGTTPSRSLMYRIIAAYDFLLEHPETTAVLSGGQGNNEDITEAQCMYNVLTGMGIAENRLLLETQSTGTHENLAYSMRIIREKDTNPNLQIAIVSSSYHLYRAKEMATSLGINATGVAAYPGWPLLALNYYIREAFGVTYLWLLG